MSDAILEGRQGVSFAMQKEAMEDSAVDENEMQKVEEDEDLSGKDA